MSRAARLGALWSGGVKDKPISNLPLGSKIKFGKYSVEGETAESIIWVVVAKNHTGYPSGAITLHTEKIIDFRCFDAKERKYMYNPSDSDKYGSNYYQFSNIHQWLNKDSAAGSWFVAQSASDYEPSSTNTIGNTPYDDRPAFLNAFSTNEKTAILTTTITALKQNGSSESLSCKVFLPSRTEIGLGNESSAEGTAWGFYANNSSRIAYVTSQAFNNSLSNNKPSSVESSWSYWLRTPNVSSVYSVRSINTSGALGEERAYDGTYGIRPVLNLPSTLIVTGTIDSDGCYNIIF